MTWGTCNDGLKGHPAMSLVARELLEDLGYPLDGWRARAQMHWPHPCYLGASYLSCGWSWLYECQAYPDTGSEACWEVGVDRYPTRYRAEVQHTWEEWWPHLCEQEGEIVRSIRARLYLAGVMLRRRHGLL